MNGDLNHDNFSPFHQPPPGTLYTSEDRQSRRNSFSDLTFQTSPRNPPLTLSEGHVNGNGTFETPFSVPSSNSSTSEPPFVSPSNLFSNAQGSIPLEPHLALSSNRSGKNITCQLCIEHCSCFLLGLSATSPTAEDFLERLTAARDRKLTERMLYLLHCYWTLHRRLNSRYN